MPEQQTAADKAKRRVAQIVHPLQHFLDTQAIGGLLLVIAAIVALVWANSPWAASYDHFWYTKLQIGTEQFHLSKTLKHWVNDGLMALFFFVVGLEIKREFLAGHLAERRSAMLPAAAALGGMVVPAGLYAALNWGRPTLDGWGIPMATDIAFAVGILALAGPRVPLALKVFLTAFAIVDDLGAVLVIALFYTDDVSWVYLVVAAITFALLLGGNRFGLRHPLPYAILGLVLWFATLKSGVHATVAGVLLAFSIPARVKIDRTEFAERVRSLLARFEKRQADPDAIEERHAIIHDLQRACEQVDTPLARMEHRFLPLVNFVIMPLFALANAGIAFSSESTAAVTSPLAWGIIAGLLVGKQIGITGFAFAAVKMNLARLPAGVTWAQVYAASWMAGIGFTMSLFIANLSFQEGENLPIAKMGILAASAVAGIVGFVLVRRTTHRSGASSTEDEAAAPPAGADAG